MENTDKAIEDIIQAHFGRVNREGLGFLKSNMKNCKEALYKFMKNQEAKACHIGLNAIRNKKEILREHHDKNSFQIASILVGRTEE